MDCVCDFTLHSDQMSSLRGLQEQWTRSTLGTETALHQLSPYIGKLKSSIASALIEKFSKPGDVILEPFSGSGSIALEGIRLGRSVLAADVSPYAAVLTKAKLYPPTDLRSVLESAERYVATAKRRAKARHYKVRAPRWVRQFFHKRTLAEAKILADTLQRRGEWFLLACLLGILHHQRPGFLSFPSSHLVPYLRAKRFPRKKFPDLYGYRDVGFRLVAKVKRAFRRPPKIDQSLKRRFIQVDIASLWISVKADVVITSPPYMNALDYGRDNRLRLWFLGLSESKCLDKKNARSAVEFHALMSQAAEIFGRCLMPQGRVVLVVGEVIRQKVRIETNRIVQEAFRSAGWRLTQQVEDLVPDIRRSRRGSRTTKREWIMIFKRVKNRETR